MAAAPETTPAIPSVHVSLNVTDLARSVAFYQAFLGVAPRKERRGYANFALGSPALKLALHEYPAGVGKGSLNHLGFVVSTLEEVNAARDRLKAAGLATFDEGDTTCCFARQNKVWAHDPDGNAWEIYVLIDDLLDDHDHDHAGNPLPAAGEPAACCVPQLTEAVPACCGQGTPQ